MGWGLGKWYRCLGLGHFSSVPVSESNLLNTLSGATVLAFSHSVTFL